MATTEVIARSAASRLSWARLWARNIDLDIYYLGLLFGLLEIFPRFFDQPDALLALEALPVALIIDAAVLSAFRASIGKWIVGVRIVDLDSKPPGLPVHLQRAWRIWLALGLGVPIVAFFTLSRSYNSLRYSEQTAWDRATSTRATAVRSSPIRTWLAAAIHLAIVLAMISLEYMAKTGASAASRADNRQIAAELNKRLPMKIDDVTTFERIDADDHEFIYRYEVKMEPTTFPSLSARLRSTLRSKYCQGASIFKYSAPVTYDYSSVKTHLGSFSFTPADCPKAASAPKPGS